MVGAIPAQAALPATDRGRGRSLSAQVADEPAGGSWPSTSRTGLSLRLALAQIIVAALLVGGIQMACVFSTTLPGPIWARALYVATGWVYIAAGVLAWSRRPSNRLGFLIVSGGLALLAGGLDVVGPPVLAAVSQVLATLCLAVLVHVLHAFPSGRLRSRASRVTVSAGYFVCLVLQIPLYLFTFQPRPYQLLAVADRPDLADAGYWLQTGAGIAVMLVTTVILADRLRRAEPRRRRTLAPLYGYGILAVLSIPLAPIVLNRWWGLSPSVVTGIQLIDLAGVPVAFSLILLRGGFARTAEIQELGAWLGTAETGRSPLLVALMRALGDASLRLVFWMPERGSYVDANGDAAELQSRRGRGTAEITLGGRRIGAIEFDATLHADPEMVRAAGRVVAIAVDHERMTAELRASQRALRQSRMRIVEAGDVERRRIARDLHDGLQVRLVLLAMQAQEVAKDLDTVAGSQEAVIALRVGIDTAAAELRDLVHAVMPAALIERGLCAATEDLVDHVPIPTRLEMTIAEHSLPTAVENTAYFVVAEALTNALKHAQPGALSVRLARIDGNLHVEVADDGLGGARLGAGSGLRGLTDRVDTLGGRLEVDSPPGHGTRIFAELPCAL
jgi:signal transduction histidine kinase